MCMVIVYGEQRASPQEELEKYLQSLGWGEDPEFLVVGVCAAPLQANAPVCDGRD